MPLTEVELPKIMVDSGGGETECNVRVVVRVRPLVARERLAGAVESLHLVPGTPQIVAGSDHSYSFDHVTFYLWDITLYL